MKIINNNKGSSAAAIVEKHTKYFDQTKYEKLITSMEKYSNKLDILIDLQSKIEKLLLTRKK